MSFDREQLNGTEGFPTAQASPEATILLVEDESSVRNLIARFLTRSNFKVLTAEDGHRALAVWAEHKSEIDLVLTDVMMPGGLRGRMMAEQLQLERPDLKVLYTSGYNEDLLNAEGSLCEGINFLQKPYRPENLLTAVRAVLAGHFNSHTETLC
jgi:CheY-like chemotaxis protein